MKTLSINDVTVHWVIDTFDGPLSGILEYDLNLYYFHCIKTSYETEGTRLYEVFEMTKCDLTKEILNHKDFQNFVGLHTDYIDNKTYTNELRSDGMDRYYKNKERRKALKTDYSGRRAVFNFEW